MITAFDMIIIKVDATHFTLRPNFWQQNRYIT